MTSASRHPRVLRLLRRQTRLGRARGFTLIELVISLAAGLVISAAAFLMARNATKFFQYEAGITTAQYGATLGMSRLQADLRLAAFMSTSNVFRDPKLCGRAAGTAQGYPADFKPLMKDLAGVTILEGASYINAPAAVQAVWDLADNTLQPDALEIAGSFDTTEQFIVQTIVPDASGSYDVVLANNTADGAMARTQLAIAGGGSPPFERIFREGRLLRLVDNEGRFALGVIRSVDTTGPNVVITVEDDPVMPTRATHENCGCEGFCVGTVVNPIARMHYDLRRVDPATYTQYAGLFEAATHGAASYHRGMAEPARTELIRVEMNQGSDDPADAEMADTLEILAEYAVDLKFGIVVETPGVPIGTFARLDINDGTAPHYDVPNALTGVPPGRPDLVRAVQVRLSTRAQQRDRDEPLARAADDGLYRFALGDGQGFARMRTLIADVQLINQGEAQP